MVNVAEVQREPHRRGDRDQELRSVPRNMQARPPAWRWPPRTRRRSPSSPATTQGIDLPVEAPSASRLAPNTSPLLDIFRYERYALDYLDVDRARKEYAALTRNGTSCVGCGDCLPACVQEIDIATKLKDVHQLLG